MSIGGTGFQKWAEKRKPTQYKRNVMMVRTCVRACVCVFKCVLMRVSDVRVRVRVRISVLRRAWLRLRL